MMVNVNFVILAKLNTLFLLEEYGLNEPRSRKRPVRDRHEEHEGRRKKEEGRRKKEEGRRKKGGKGVINYLWWALPTLL